MGRQKTKPAARTTAREDDDALALDDIILDEEIQARASLSMAVVKEYAAAMKRGDKFDPIIVYRDRQGKNWLADGFHRHNAARLAGLDSFSTTTHLGERRNALLHALGANAAHGLRRTNNDKRKAVELMLADAEWRTWSDNRIAQHIGVSHVFVGKARSACNGYKVDVRKGLDGKEYEVGGIGAGGPVDEAAPVEVAAPAPQMPVVADPPVEDEWEWDEHAELARLSTLLGEFADSWKGESFKGVIRVIRDYALRLEHREGAK